MTTPPRPNARKPTSSWGESSSPAAGAAVRWPRSSSASSGEAMSTATSATVTSAPMATCSHSRAVHQAPTVRSSRAWNQRLPPSRKATVPPIVAAAVSTISAIDAGPTAPGRTVAYCTKPSTAPSATPAAPSLTRSPTSGTSSRSLHASIAATLTAARSAARRVVPPMAPSPPRHSSSTATTSRATAPARARPSASGRGAAISADIVCLLLCLCAWCRARRPERISAARECAPASVPRVSEAACGASHGRPSLLDHAPHRLAADGARLGAPVGSECLYEHQPATEQLPRLRVVGSRQRVGLV